LKVIILVNEATIKPELDATLPPEFLMCDSNEERRGICGKDQKHEQSHLRSDWVV
jgi:hypothetical protein